MTPQPTPIPVLAGRAKAASRELATASTTLKNDALCAAADLLMARSADVLAANALDVAAAEAAGIGAGLVDRLRLDGGRIAAMAAGLEQVATLPDPVGAVLDGWVRPNGLRISRVRVPLGVVAIIYESRPNVTSDAAALCLKSGNAAFLRGSSTAFHSNTAIAEVLRGAVASAGLPEDSIVLVDDTSRDAATEFMQQRGLIDCLIPRGGASLIASILEHATVPFVIDGDGNCHVYVDAAADLDMAEAIVVNAKTQRPSVCNAAESLVLHEAVAAPFLARVDAALSQVDLVGDDRSRSLLARIGEATQDDFAREFLDLKMSVRVVDSLDEAIAHVNDHSSGHSEAIVTEDLRSAERFLAEVDAAAVLVNASTRFVDGEEFGFGAEIGISTQKLHARGPMGLAQLTTAKYVVRGDGQTRGLIARMDAGDTASLAGLVAAFEPGADPLRAEQMRAYMRGRFEFLGITSPQRRRRSAPFLASMEGAGEQRLLGVAGQLWAMPRREYAYVAADLLRKYERALGPTALGPLRDLVTTDSWWDGVDPLSHIVGSIVRARPEAADQMDRWVEDPDLWVVRVAIIHQLGWKADAEPSRIFGYCEARSDHPDFFVRKAIGWALRDLARTFPTNVRDFVEAHRSELSPLSVREATKHLRNESPGAGGALGGRLTP